MDPVNLDVLDTGGPFDRAREDRRKKVIVLGDGAVGKTCMILVFTTGKFPDYTEPTIYDTDGTNGSVTVDGTLVDLSLWDTTGQEDYDRLRPLTYPNTSVILMCYSIDNRDSAKNIQEKWVPEMTYYCPRVPFVLVGTKIDLRQDKTGGDDLMTRAEGVRLAAKIKARTYVECSAKTRQGLRQVFEAAARATLKSRGRRCCLIL